jgi:hypothetical protein
MRKNKIPNSEESLVHCAAAEKLLIWEGEEKNIFPLLFFLRCCFFGADEKQLFWFFFFELHNVLLKKYFSPFGFSVFPLEHGENTNNSFQHCYFQQT